MRCQLSYLLILSALCPAAIAEVYHVPPSGDDAGTGTAQTPWRTIQRAADALKPGDTALLAAGTYRESVMLQKGGTPPAPITLAAEPGARVVITGADPLAVGWSRVAGDDPVYEREWPHLFQIDHRNGRPVMTHPDDAEHALIGRAEQVIEHGRLLRQVLRRAQLAPGTFMADVETKKLYVWLRAGNDPAKTEVEASVRGTWIVGEPSASYVQLRGITFRYAANFAQRGGLTLSRDDKGAAPQNWLVEDCVFEKANASGASLGGRGHLFRRCVFQDNGQLGFGTSQCHDTRMEECGIYRNNTKGYSTGWEAGGLKVTMSRGFVFDHCRVVDNRGPGVWYDIGNERAEVANCYIADNDEGGIFYEISYGLHAHHNLIVNNANLGQDPGRAWGMGGITLSSSEDCIIEHNTLAGNRDGIAFREQDRNTPRIGQRDEVRIFNRNHVIRQNIIANSGAYNVALWFDMPFFDRRPGKGAVDPATLNIKFENNLLWPLGGRPNYLFGASWKAKSKACITPADCTMASSIADTSLIADPLFINPAAGDFHVRETSPAIPLKAGAGNNSPGKR